jgi:hypothetical protein
MINAGRKDFPTSAGILLGLGMGGFFDGIVLHQLLQWHHMLTSAGYPADSVPNLELNTFWEGLPSDWGCNGRWGMTGRVFGWLGNKNGVGFAPGGNRGRGFGPKRRRDDDRPPR